MSGGGVGSVHGRTGINDEYDRFLHFIYIYGVVLLSEIYRTGIITPASNISTLDVLFMLFN